MVGEQKYKVVVLNLLLPSPSIVMVLTGKLKDLETCPSATVHHKFHMD
jgi:hypothetical protein